MTTATAIATASPTSTDTTDPRLRGLPRSALTKFERLRRAELRSNALRDGLWDEAQRVRERRDHAALQLGSFDRAYPPEASYEYKEDTKTGTRTRVPAIFPERVAIVERIESCKSELARIAAEQAACNLGYSTIDILDWLARSPGKFVTVPAPVIKLNKGESFADALKRTRHAQASLRSELAVVENARRTIAEAKVSMRAEVARLAEKGRPEVASLFHGHGIEWPTEQFTAGGHGAHQHVVTSTIKDTFAVTVWAHKDAIIAQLDAEIERAGDDATALSAEAQAARLTELQDALVQLQRQEEAMIEKLESEGQQVRRNCSDPRIILGLDQ